MNNNLDPILVHPLALYRERYQLSCRQLAQVLKLSRQTTYNYIQQRKHPSQKIKQQIALLTNQEVPVNSWPPPPPRKIHRLRKQPTSIILSNNPLEAYRQKMAITYVTLAERLNLKYQTLYSYLSGRVYPPIEVKEQIALLTNQEVPVESWPPSSKRKPGRPEGIGKPLKKRTP